MDKSNYSKSFSTNKMHAIKLKHERNKLALEKAHEIRKFEIELYWKRTAYIWTLIAAMFAGYCIMASKPPIAHSYTHIYLIFIASTGFVFSFSWFLINKGSKYWQENWEFHIDSLEDNITGPLYKTVLQRDESMNYKENWKNDVLLPQPFSVSKINQFIALYTMFIWGALMLIPTTSAWESLFIVAFILFIIKKVHSASISEIKDEAKPIKIKAINRKTIL